MPTLALLIPVFNEEPTLRAGVERLVATPPPPGVQRRIIAIDDGSTDAGPAHLMALSEEHPGLITVLRHPRNLGKGAALAAGLERACEADIVLIHDADLEYNPADHAAVLAPILDGRADAVIGSRFRGGTPHRVLYYWHSIANRLITAFSNATTNLNLSDIECCTKAFTGEVARRLVLRERGFGVEPEIIARLAHMRLPDEQRPGAERPLRIYEVPVSYAGRTYAEGKKIRWTDGLHALWCIVRYGLLRAR